MIKARVFAKSEVKQFSSARGEGKLFSFDLLDESVRAADHSMLDAVHGVPHGPALTDANRALRPCRRRALRQGEIRATAFGEAVNKFFDVVQVGQVYIISRGSLKQARKAYSSIKHDYEIGIDNNTQIDLVWPLRRVGDAVDPH